MPTLKDTLDPLFKRWDFLQTLWAFHLTFSLGVIGIFSTRGTSAKILVVTAFTLFAGAHLAGLLTVLGQWGALAEVARNQMNTEQASTQGYAALSKLLKPPPRWGLIAFHLVVDSVVVVSVWHK